MASQAASVRGVDGAPWTAVSRRAVLRGVHAVWPSVAAATSARRLPRALVSRARQRRQRSLPQAMSVRRSSLLRSAAAARAADWSRPSRAIKIIDSSTERASLSMVSFQFGGTDGASSSSRSASLNS